MSAVNAGTAGRKCSDCGRPMRTSTQRAEQNPGTVAYHSNGLCSACHTRTPEGKAAYNASLANREQRELDARPGRTDPLTADEQIVLTRFASQFAADPELADMLGLVLS